MSCFVGSLANIVRTDIYRFISSNFNNTYYQNKHTKKLDIT